MTALVAVTFFFLMLHAMQRRAIRNTRDYCESLQEVIKFEKFEYE